MRAIIDDVRFAYRALRARPGFVIAAVLTLALGIGANTAIFSVINAFMLKPLPYPDGERLVEIHNTYPGNGLENAGVSVPDYLDRREQASALADSALYTWSSFNLAASGAAERLLGLVASPSLFSTLRVSPLIGRSFSEDEAVPGNERVAILTHEVWSNRFGSDRGIVGKDIRLNGDSYRVIGVMPQGFSFPNRDVDLYVPFAFTPEMVSDESRGWEFSTSIGRLKPGATIAQLDAQMDAIVQSNKDRFVGASERAADYAEFLERTGFTGRAQTWREYQVGDVRLTLLVLQGVVVFVLLIACANVANLMLARVLGRAKELAVRAAVGAERLRVSRQLVFEGVLLGLGGGFVGLSLSWIVIRLIELFGIDRSAQNFDVVIDPWVLAFAFFVSVAAGIAFSLISVIALWRLDLQQVVKEGGGQTASRGALFARGVLVSLQVAMAATLLIGAGLLLRSFEKLLNESPGFNPEDVVAVQMELSGSKYSDDNERRRFLDAVLAGIERQPGVVAAGATNVLPFNQDGNQASYDIEGRTLAAGESSPHGHSRTVSADYFRAMGIPLLRGRLFDAALDGVDSPHAVIIDQLLADKYFADENPIGRRISNQENDDGEPVWSTIVGVVGTIKGDRLHEAPSKETYYHFYRQRPPGWASLVVRTVLPAASAGRQISAAVLAVDPEQPVFNMMSMSERIEQSLGSQRAPTLLLSVFAVVAVLLAVVGIYGVLAYVVGQRTTELGVRMALGAQSSNVLGLVLGQGAWLVGAGLVFGVLAAFALTRFLASLLFGVSTFDPLTYLLVPLLLVAVGLAACTLPALRATRISPVAALRHQ
ncbi:MAG TPA: ABC transporter permease [Woeseiaceae bacterium]|nr:ABC transporter permease [Woeseiaceae bacterium]